MFVQYPVIALVLSSASDLCNNQDIVLAPGYNYNLSASLWVYQECEDILKVTPDGAASLLAI